MDAIQQLFELGLIDQLEFILMVRKLELKRFIESGN